MQISFDCSSQLGNICMPGTVFIMIIVIAVILVLGLGIPDAAAIEGCTSGERDSASDSWGLVGASGDLGVRGRAEEEGYKVGFRLASTVLMVLLHEKLPCLESCMSPRNICKSNHRFPNSLR